MYLNWNTKINPHPDFNSINDLYSQGYVATRVDKGIFNQTRSLRIDLSKFEASSENRRIIRKVEGVKVIVENLPYKEYHWSIHKMAKDFYTDKFGKDIFSANKVKELLTQKDKSNFNKLLIYKEDSSGTNLGYCICLETDQIFHYSYPFYRQTSQNPSMGLGMMILAINYAQQKKLRYIYLGSLQRPSDTYKLQFTGAEWFDGTTWQSSMKDLKTILHHA